MKKRLLVIIALSFLIFRFAFSDNTDTFKIDVIHYSIYLDSIDIAGNQIFGHCMVKFQARENINKIYLMLKALQTDSVINTSKKLTFAFVDPIIEINAAETISKDKVDSIIIYYHGKPTTDIRWGGFYFSSADGGYAYNIGIGMDDFPNSYGRVWFPCIDNFTDRATYSLFIHTKSTQKAFCGGLLAGKQIHPDGSLTWHWEMKKPVPTDLVSVAVGNYVTVQFEHQGINKKFPVIYGVLAADSTKMKSSFARIHQALDIFENSFGPYLFDKVGYVCVPFSMGAMEHAENITYPRYAVDGSLNYESLWAHEMSHSWWGNPLKCKEAGDMWLNEGWADYSEYLFIEGIYGDKAYHDAIGENHKYVLQFAHIIDDSALALSPVPHTYTYGTHVYKKGGDVVHTLRGYMGDSLFFSSIRKYQSVMAFKNHTSLDLRDSLSKYSGFDLKPFFENWVFEKGFPHFTVTSMVNDGIGNHYTVEITQEPRFTNRLYSGVPLTLTFISRDQIRSVSKINMNGYSKIFSFDLPFEADMVALNIESSISDAVTRVNSTLKSTGTYNFNEALMEIDVKSIQDSAFILVEHHWVGPEHSNTALKGIRFSDYRYWSVKGLFPPVFNAVATVWYNGKAGTSYDNLSYLDHTLNIINEDSLVLLYRKDPKSSWTLCDNYTLYTLVNKNDKYGSIKINNLKQGDYCIGKYDYYTGINENIEVDNGISIFPNPAKNSIQVHLKDNNGKYNIIRLVDSSGRIFYQAEIGRQNKIIIPLPLNQSHIFVVELIGDNSLYVRKIISTD